MADAASSSTHDAIRELLLDQALRSRLIRHAYARCGSVAHAKDIVQEAVKSVLEGSMPWQRDTCPHLIDHLGTVVNAVSWNKANSAATKCQHGLLPLCARVVDALPNAERALIEREQARKLALVVERCMAALRERLEGDEIADVVLDLFEHGVESADLQAKAAERLRAEIDQARRRIGYHAEVVIRAQRQAGALTAREIAR